MIESSAVLPGRLPKSWLRFTPFPAIRLRVHHAKNVPELPWIKWFPTNWSSDPGLAMCDAATRGIWADAVNAMLNSGLPHVEGTVEQLSRLCRCRPTQMQSAICELRQFNVCSVDEQNGCIILTCRRLLREFNLSNLRSNAAKQRWNKNNANAHAPSAYAYASVSTSKEGGVGGTTYSAASRVIVVYLREQSGRDFREVESNLSLIQARLNEPGVTLDGVKKMIDRQIARWKGTSQEEYLRPTTLFGKEKFDGYYAARELPINLNREAGGANRQNHPDRNKGTLNEGCADDYDLKKVQAARAVRDVPRPAANGPL